MLLGTPDTLRGVPEYLNFFAAAKDKPKQQS
jgi:hypothetical protein